MNSHYLPKLGIWRCMTPNNVTFGETAEQASDNWAAHDQVAEWDFQYEVEKQEWLWDTAQR